MKKLWKWLDGNKTMICFGISVILQQGIKADILPDTKYISWIIGIFSALGVPAAIHHIKKGYFSTKKGS